MMSFEPVIDRLRVESFRGFRDAREFDLSAESVIITGPNGTGKTSFFDALQWGLLGRLERLETLRSRRNAEYIVNQYRLGHKACVEIDLRLPSGPVTVRRTGDQGGSTLELRRAGEASQFGAEAEETLRKSLLPGSELALESALTTSGLMQQDVMRSILEAKPADRYTQLSTVLGLGVLEDFEDATRALAKQASEREKSARDERTKLTSMLERAQASLDAARARLATRPQVAAVREEAFKSLAAAPLGVTFIARGVTLEGPDEVRHAAAAFGQIAERVEATRGLISQARQLRTGLSETSTEELLGQLRADLSRAEAARAFAETSRKSAVGQLESARKAAADIAQLAAMALPMLSDDCPVCKQSIDRDHVERELRERAEAAGALLELKQSVSALTEQSKRVAAAAATAREDLASAEEEAERWNQVYSLERAAEMSLDALAEQTPVVEFDRMDLASFYERSDSALQYFRRARRALHDLLETIETQSDQGAVERASAEVRSCETLLAAQDDQFELESARSKKFQRLADQTIKARVEVTESRLRSIQPLVANIFQRLDPHPAFKTVEFELDTYYRKGTTSPLVIDQVENVSADPLLIFSTSQANIVALSYFIAMSLSSEGRGLPFLLLDDPVQSMDDVNVLGFADLCRHLRTRRQIIVSTHERRFASLLERKLAPRVDDSRTKVITFVGWDRSGPTVREHLIEAQLLEDPIRVVKAS